jgi:signal transduction histidine kinase/CheY-like chemotaxis protein
VDRVVAPERRNHRHHRSMARLCLQIPAATLVTVPFHLVTLPEAVPWALVGAPLHALALVAVRRGSLALGLHLCLTALLWHLVVLSWFAGGLGAPPSWFMAMLPTIPLFARMHAESVLWTAITCGVCVAFAGAAFSGIAMPPGYPEGMRNGITLAAVLALVFGNLFVAQGLLSARQRLREQLKELSTEMVSLSEAKKAFTATMSHELRTPMNGVIGLTSLLLQTDLDAEQREYAKTIRSSARSLHRIVNELLDFSVLERDGIRLEPSPFAMHLVIRQVLDVFRVAARHKGLELNMMIGPHVPTKLSGDAGRVRQVLYNLVSNAVKFTNEGAITIRARCLGETAERTRIALEVIDTGIGIPESEQRHIFERFRQVDGGDARIVGGAGLGLAICYGVVTAMGGTIHVASRAGRGSTFCVELDFALVHTDETIDDLSGDITVDPRQNPFRPQRDQLREDVVQVEQPVAARVLLVEDNPVNQRVVTAMLERIGCMVDSAADGREGVALALSHPYDLVLMDCQLPEMDGYDAARAIRSQATNGPDLPIVALTTDARGDARRRARAAGMSDFLTKPVTLQALERVVTAWRDASHTRQG